MKKYIQYLSLNKYTDSSVIVSNDERRGRKTVVDEFVRHFINKSLVENDEISMKEIQKRLRDHAYILRYTYLVYTC